MVWFWNLLTIIQAVDVQTIPSHGIPPLPNKAPCLVYNDTQVIYAFGGHLGTDKSLDNIYVFDIEKNHWEEIIPFDSVRPSKRYGSFCFIKNKYVYVYGGTTIYGTDNDLWAFDTVWHKWEEINMAGRPNRRYSFSYADFMKNESKTFAIFGGFNETGVSAGLYLFDIESLIWTKRHNGPFGIAGSSMVYYNDSIYVVGGVTKDQTLFTGILKYQIEEDTWSSVDCEAYPGRTKFSSFMHDSDLYIMYGYSDEKQKLEKSIYKADLSAENCKFTEVSVSNINKYAAFNYGHARALNKIYIFGGVLDSNITNALVLYSPNDGKSIKELSTRYTVPNRVIHASLVSMAGNLYLFGGKNGDEYYNELWKFDIAKTSWIKMKYYGDTPSPRSHHTAAADGDVMVIFGGKDSNSLFNDAYSFNIISLTWTLLKYVGRNPSVRSGSCLMMNLPMMYLYGGEGASSYSVTLWAYNMSDATYFPHEDSKGFDPGHLQGCFLSDDGEEVTILYGTTDGDRPLGYVVNFNLKSLKWTNTFYPNDSLFRRSTALIGKVGKNYYVIGGSVWASEAFYDIIKVEPDKQKSSIVGKIDKYTYQSAYARDRSKIYFYGGGSWYKNLIRYNIASNNFYSLDFLDFCTDDCHLVCAPGSYYINGTCELCPEGTFNSFYGKQECELCRKGTYNSIKGASSKRQCFPCNQGEHSNTEGNSRCRQCEAGYYCPIGSIYPIIYQESMLISSDQPDSFERGTREASEMNLNVQLAVSLVLCILFLFIFCIKKFRGCLISIDVFDDSHNYEDEVPLVTRKTLIGGIFSFMYYIAAFNMIATAFIMLDMDNIEEIKSLIPLVVLNEISPKLTANVAISIFFGNYGGECIQKGIEKENICDPSIFYVLSEVQYSKADFSCELKGLDCYVYLSLDDCEIDSTTDVTIKLLEKFAYTSNIAVNVTSDSSIPNQKSSSKIVAYPAEGTMFRGMDPTVFRFSLTPTLFSSDTEDHDYTGYHVAALSLASGGSTYSADNLGFTADLSVRISLERSINGLQIERRYIFTLYLTILTLLGSIPGIKDVIGYFMEKVEEKYLNRIEKRKNQIKFDDIIGKRTNMKSFLHDNYDEDNVDNEDDKNFTTKIFNSPNLESSKNPSLNRSIERPNDASVSLYSIAPE